MNRKAISTESTASSVVRCAIYTRKSNEEGLEQEFNSLDSQRESAEAYIKRQQHEGWICLPDRYEDGGFTGGNMARPAFRIFMADIEASRIDCVVVYKLSRNTCSSPKVHLLGRLTLEGKMGHKSLLGTTYVPQQVLTCGHPETFGNLGSRRRSLTPFRHGSRLQTEILWRTCKVIHSALHGFRLRLEDQKGRLRSYLENDHTPTITYIVEVCRSGNKV